MYERFSDRARKVMHLANNEAQKLNQEYVGTEHLLLGILKEGSGVACNVLRNLNVDYCTTAQEVNKLVQPGPLLATMGKLPVTPRVKKVLELAIEESKNLGHNYIGTEHLLLGLLKEDLGVAGQVLKNLGLHVDTIRKEIIELLSWEPSGEEKKTDSQYPERSDSFTWSNEVQHLVAPDETNQLLQLKPLLEKQCDLLEKILKVLTEWN